MISAYLGFAGLSGVGYRFYNLEGTPIAARVTDGVEESGDGWYRADVLSGVAASVRWDCTTVTDLSAIEYFDGSVSFKDTDRANLETIQAKLSIGIVNIQSPVSALGTVVTLIRGNDYAAADGRSLDFAVDGWPVLSGGTVVFRLTSGLSSSVKLSIVGQIIAARTARVELTAADTELLLENSYNFDLTATLANQNVVTLARGRATVTAAT